MKPIFYKAAIVVLSHIMLATCAKESEEQTTDEDDDYYEVMIGKSTPEKERLAAVHEWTTFKSDAEKLLSIAKSNLNTLGVKINKNQDDQQLLELFTKSEKQYIDLKLKLETENKNLLRDPGNLSETAIKANRSFRQDFKSQLIQLNIDLEDAIENDMMDAGADQ